MRIALRPIGIAMSAVVLVSGAGLAGCASKSAAAPRTVIVTVTGEATATDGGTGSTGGSSGVTSAPSTSASAAPTVDPLKADCAKVLTAEQLTATFGQLAAGTDRVVEPANPERQITGRLKCQYGVSDDKSAIAVQVVLAQFESAAGAAAQMATTVSSEKTLGAKAATATVGDQPATVLVRDGGLLVLGYDTWTLSVAIDKNVVTDDTLVSALEQTADQALTAVLAG